MENDLEDRPDGVQISIFLAPMPESPSGEAFDRQAASEVEEDSPRYLVEGSLATLRQQIKQ
eukprot:1149267-Pelagomonas_calceolata.AAC.3